VLKEIATTPEKEKIFGMLIEARDNQAKAAQQQMEIQEELAKAEVAKTNAEAISQLSRAKEAEGRASSYAGLHAEHAIQAKKGNADAVASYSSAVKTIAEMLEMFDESSISRATDIVESIAEAGDDVNLDQDMETLDSELGQTTKLFEQITNQGNGEQNAYQG
jgi:predicted O-linked N-acetylglucosamine transferase (SPINDLY family)